MRDELQEKEIEAGNTSPTASDHSPYEPKEFVPINGPTQTRNQNNSLARATSSSLKSISRSRSNNGYGCGNQEDSDESADVEGGMPNGGADKDPFEVRWDNGDSDAMNPRSMGLGRKWVVVLIVSASSLCV